MSSSGVASQNLLDAEDAEDRVRQIFNDIDTNGDGLIDEDELVAAMDRLCHSDQQNVFLAEFHKIDEDDSGGIDFNEFVEYYNNMMAFQLSESSSSQVAGISVQIWSSGDLSVYAKLSEKLFKRNKISKDDIENIRYMFDTKFCLLDLKMALCKYRRSESILPLRRFLDKIDSAVTRHRALEDHFWVLHPDETADYTSITNRLFEKKEITYQQKEQLLAMIKTKSEPTELKAAFILYKTENNIKMLMNLLSVFGQQKQSGGKYSVKQTTSEFDGKMVKHNALYHDNHDKEYNLSLMKAANLFYGSSGSVAFDDTLVEGMHHVVDGLKEQGFLNAKLAKKAKVCLEKRDKYAIYALYRYDSDFSRLNTYLKLKVDDEEKDERKKAREERYQERKREHEAELEERRMHLLQQQEVLGGQTEIKRRRDSKLAEEKRLAEEAARYKQEEEERAKQAKQKQSREGNAAGAPRWMKLYEMKFKSISIVLEAESKDPSAPMGGSVSTPTFSNGGSRYVVR